MGGQGTLACPANWVGERMLKKRPPWVTREGAIFPWKCNRLKVFWVEQQQLEAQLIRRSSEPSSSLAVDCTSRGYMNSDDEYELRRLCEGGQLQKALHVLSFLDQQGAVLSVESYRRLLQTCMKKGALAEIKELHAHIAEKRLETSGLLGETLVSALVKCGDISGALQLFLRLHHRSVFGWTAIISGLTKAGEGFKALQMYQQMLGHDVRPNKHTFLGLLRACSSSEDLRWVHAEIVRHNCESDLFVGTTVLDMYARCGSMVEAQLVFDNLSDPDIASWNALISGYAQVEHGQKAFDLYLQMKQDGVRPNERTFVSLLKACGKLASMGHSSAKNDALGQGRILHTEAAELGYESNIFVCSSLIHMYATCGSIEVARNVFNALAQGNVVSWNAMLTAYVQENQSEEALQLYAQMQVEGVNPDDRTFVIVVTACASLAEREEDMLSKEGLFMVEALRKGKAIHAEVVQRGYQSNLFVANTLIQMYANCGSILDAKHVFDLMSKRDVVTWNAIISAYVQQQQGEQALVQYAKMQLEGVQPNEATFLWALKACSDVGTLSVCNQIHHQIMQSRSALSLTLGTALIHAYGNCGNMLDARHVFHLLPQKDIVVWNALISGYARQGEWVMTLQCFEELQHAGISPDAVTFVLVLSACSHCGMVEKGIEYFVCMTQNYGIAAEVDHFAALVDLLGRAGLLVEAEDVLSRMPMQPDLAVFLSLLGACRKYENLDLGKRVFELAVRLQPKQGAAYLLMANIYSDAGMWDEAKEVDELRRRSGSWNKPGQSWIEHKHEVHVFMAGDLTHSQSKQVSARLRELSLQLVKEGSLDPLGPSPRHKGQ